jgi:opacity protein-like surface antigen
MKRTKTVGLLALLGIALMCMPAAADPMTWSGSLYGGYAKMQEDEAPGGSFGIRGNMFATMSPVIGLGAELGYHGFGTETYDIGGGETLDLSASTIQATAQMRARGVNGTVRPYGMFGLGMYSLKVTAETGGVEASESEGKFGFNLGAGLQFMPNPTKTMSFGVEARWHSIMDGWINEDGEESALDAITLMAGVNFN